MRTVILLGALIIGFYINPTLHLPEESQGFTSLVLTFSILMDVVEWFINTFLKEK